MSMSYFRRRLLMNYKNTHYVDGIAFHLDCNNGYNGTTWTELISGKQFTMNGTTKGADGGIVFNGNADGSCPYDFGFRTDTCTIEVVYKQDIRNIAQLIFMPNKNDRIAFGFLNSSNNIIWATTPITTSDYPTFITSMSDINSVSVNLNRAISNNKELSVGSGNYWLVYSDSTCIGSRKGNGNFFHGEIYAIRIYNRILTKEEILHNHLIDYMKYIGGCTPIDYLEADGNQWIDTGLMSENRNITYDTEIMWTKLNIRQLIGGDRGYYFGINSSGFYEMSTVFNVKGSTTSYDKIHFKVQDLHTELYVNNTLIGTRGATGNQSIYIFGVGKIDGGYGYGCETYCKMKGFKITQDNVLVRDFIPCINKEGVKGMYDLVGKKFYGSVSGTPFKYLEVI